MTQPVQHLRGGMDNPARRYGGPGNHDHRQAQSTRRVQLGARAVAAGILGYDQLNPVALHQRPVLINGERAASDFNRGTRQRQLLGRIDQTQQIAMRGAGQKRRKALSANGQEHRPGRLGQGRDGRCEIGHALPIIARAGLPGRTLKRQQGHPCIARRRDGIGADLSGEGMGRVDQMCYALRAQIGAQPGRPAKPANAGGYGLRFGRTGAPGIGVLRRDAPRGQSASQRRRLGCAAKKKDACHG